jgi:hypothetical protein
MDATIGRIDFRTSFLEMTKFFTLLHTFIRGWDESEFPRILHSISKKYNLSKLLISVLPKSSFKAHHIHLQRFLGKNDT